MPRAELKTYAQEEAERYSIDESEKGKAFEAMPGKTRKFYEDARRRIVTGLAETFSVPKSERGFLDDIAGRLNEEYTKNGSVSQDTVDELFDTAWYSGLIVDGDFYCDSVS